MVFVVLFKIKLKAPVDVNLTEEPVGSSMPYNTECIVLSGEMRLISAPHNLR